MRLVCISDSHNAHKGLHLPEGEVLIHAGDAIRQGLISGNERFLDWFGASLGTAKGASMAFIAQFEVGPCFHSCQSITPQAHHSHRQT
jgi:hypothetical protein